MEMKTVNIKGKDYVPVNERIKAFRADYPLYSLTTKIIELNEKRVVMVAEITSDDGHVVATGHAYEDASNGYINKTSYIENCETSAWGRALANLGIGIDASMCSADELANALKNQDNAPQEFENEPPKAITKQQISNLEAVFKNMPDGGKMLMPLLLGEKKLESLTNIEYAQVLTKINEMESEGVKNIKKYIAAYAKSKGIKNSGDAAKEIETVLGIKLLAKPLEWKGICQKIQELAEK